MTEMQRPATRRFPRLRILGTAIFALLVYAAFAGTSWLTYDYLRLRFDEELNRRLVSVGQAAAAMTDKLWLAGAMVGQEDYVAASRQRETFERLRTSFDLANVFIVDRRDRTLATASDIVEPGEVNPFLEEDRAAVDSAWAGKAKPTRLYAIDTLFFKSAYIPILSRDKQTLAVIGIEAGVNYFTELNRLRRLFLTGNLIFGGVVLFFTVVFLTSLRRIDRMEGSVIRSGQLALLGQLSGMVAHEVRNPLAIIRASAERLKKKFVPEPVGQEVVGYILEESERLETLLSNYLEFARPEHGAPETCQVDLLLESIVKPVAREYGIKGYTVTFVPGTGELVTTLRTRSLRQAVLNLLLNAIQAQPEGGEVELRTSLERGNEGDTLVIRVRDRGPGLSPEARKHLFEPLWTSKEKGSGLGLFLVRRVVDEQHGMIAFNNHPDGGLEVVMDLPVDHAL